MMEDNVTEPQAGTPAESKRKPMTELEAELVARGLAPFDVPMGGRSWGEPTRDYPPQRQDIGPAGWAALTLCTIALLTFVLVLVKGWPL